MTTDTESEDIEWAVFVYGNYISSHLTRDEASEAAYAIAYDTPDAFGA